MSNHETKEGLLTEADLAAYGIPAKHLVEPILVKTRKTALRRKSKMMKPSTQDRTERTGKKLSWLSRH